jgi:hypothetical protein
MKQILKLKLMLSCHIPIPEEKHIWFLKEKSGMRVELILLGHWFGWIEIPHTLQELEVKL